MAIPFSQRPGRHERHYLRRTGNPLFPGSPQEQDDAALLDAQRLDHEELLAFLADLRAAVRRAAELQPNEGSEVILEIKEQLDRLYEMSAGLAEDHSHNQAALAQLLEVIMRNVERGAAADPQALDELGQERLARAAHFSLLASPLVADLLHPQSVISAADLAPTLLSATEDDLASALQLFDLEQTIQLCTDARECLAAHGQAPADARARCTQVEERLAELRRQAVLN